MILTVTPNPTLDRAIFVRHFDLGGMVRAEREVVTPSGKGVDSSLVIHELGGETVAAGLKAGRSGQVLEDLLDEMGISHDFLPAEGETRTAVVLVDLAVGQQSTITVPTLSATEGHLSQLLALVDRYAPEVAPSSRQGSTQRRQGAEAQRRTDLRVLATLRPCVKFLASRGRLPGSRPRLPTAPSSRQGSTQRRQGAEAQRRTNLRVLASLRPCVKFLAPRGRLPGSRPRLPTALSSHQGSTQRRQGAEAQSWGVIFGGTLPPGLPPDSYAHLLRHARGLGLVTLLDSSGQSLRRGVVGLPHVLKINRHELRVLDAEMASEGENAGRDDLPEDVAGLAGRLGKRLGEWASDALIVTLGGQGCLAVTREGTYRARPPQVPVVNTAGAGDALNGGVMLARSRGADWPTALALGTAAAASVVTTPGTAICRREQVAQLLPLVRITVSPPGATG